MKNYIKSNFAANLKPDCSANLKSNFVANFAANLKPDCSANFPLKQLLTWYNKNKRDFPWRNTKDPYKIWVSEVMLQQTTSSAVVAYYHNFLKIFPNLKSLALAKEKTVLQAWAGLGYYSRAKNLHKSAIQIHKSKNFPQSYNELLKLPGFGNYTSRSVSSFAFNETVGVLDTNVIRFVCRYNNLSLEWWKTKPRKILQSIVDSYALQTINNSLVTSAELNQALIEIGANICASKTPQCVICPLSQTCKAFKQQTYFKLPLKKNKTSLQKIYALNMQILTNHKKEIALDTLEKKPFLKNMPLPPSKIIKLSTPPTKYDFIHYITCYKIFVSVKTNTTKQKKSYLWVKPKQAGLHSPTSLLTKAIKLADKI
ncbi:MAG: A/G-specific adenine glycosylase [Bdellovibrionaceae bacterium]|nr:A/G-specific adenine glycosylase [Pseudobdellovibrionaceae bacterium]